ncbi:MAG: hypothetical protein R2882_08335 [Gemmatimonadales bacterium]
MTKRSRRGTSTLGCLFSLLITVVVVYYALNAGRVLWRFYELRDRMESAARFAANQTDEQILRQLRADAVDIGVPSTAQRFQINRIRNPRQITISTTYEETIELPFVHRKVVFKPSVTQRL